MLYFGVRLKSKRVLKKGSILKKVIPIFERLDQHGAMPTLAIFIVATIAILPIGLLAQSPTPSGPATTLPSIPIVIGTAAPPSVMPAAVNPSPTQAPASVTTPPDVVLEYQKTLADQSKRYQEFLCAETDRHQEFLKHLFTIIASVAGAAGTIFLSFLAWFNLSTRRDALTQITGDLKVKVEAAVADKLKEFEAHLGTSKAEVDKQVDDVKKNWTKRQEKFEAEYDKKLAQLRTYTDKELTTIAEYASVIGHAAVVLGAEESKDPPELREKTRAGVAEKLEKLQQKVPTHRTVAVFTGRMFRFMGDLERSIKVLDRCIEARKVAGLGTGADQAALFYNKACYLNILAGERRDEALRNRAWESLLACVQLEPTDLKEAQVDPDLKDIVESGERKWEDLIKQKPG
jgi:hypothetical protein